MYKFEFSLTQEILKGILYYNKQTGIFNWRERDRSFFNSDRAFKSWNSRFCGRNAGTIKKNSNGISYYQIVILGKKYYAHRLAYLYITGIWPPVIIDHEDGDGLNNTWTNIKQATYQENSKNREMSRANKTGCMGVTFSKERKKWIVKVNISGRSVQLGSFDDFFDAVCSRKSGERLYGYHQNHGRIIK